MILTEMRLLIVPLLLSIIHLNFAESTHETNGLDIEYNIDQSSISNFDLRRGQSDVDVPTLDEDDDGGLTEDIIELAKRRGWGKRASPERVRQLEWALRNGYGAEIAKRKGWGKRARGYEAMMLAGQLSAMEKRKGWGKRSESICDSMVRSIAELYQTIEQINGRLEEENCARYRPAL